MNHSSHEIILGFGINECFSALIPLRYPEYCTKGRQLEFDYFTCEKAVLFFFVFGYHSQSISAFIDIPEIGSSVFMHLPHTNFHTMYNASLSLSIMACDITASCPACVSLSQSVIAFPSLCSRVPTQANKVCFSFVRHQAAKSS